MKRKIYLHGALAKRYGSSFDVDVCSPAEAVRALCVMLEGFEMYITSEERHYQVFRGAEIDERDQNVQELGIRFSDSEVELHIFPCAKGAKRGGIGKIILGTLLVLASFVVPGGWAIAGKAISALVAQAGVALVLGGISQVLSGRPASSDYDSREQPKSELFNGALNVSSPGVAVPVIVGACEVGSVVVSAAIHIEDRIVVTG